MPDQPFPRVFVSHSSADKDFVRVLVGELQDAGVDTWFDEQQLSPGDSIVSGISGGLSDTDYLLVVLSKNSVQSNWVTAELNAALMLQLSDGGTTVIPVVIDDCDIPVLLRDIVYADFKASFTDAMRRVLEVLQMEDASVSYSSTHATKPKPHLGSDECPVGGCMRKLSTMSDADIRRAIHDRLALDEIRAVWMDTFGTDMYDSSRDKTKLDRSIDLILEANREKKRDKLIENLCRGYAHKMPC
ncbi:MAG: toll/interleukin-1 receptor domain-containing protein [Pseudomonadota bacterium]